MADMAVNSTRTDLRRALSEAEFRRLLDMEEAATGVRRGRTGAAALREGIRLHLPQLAHSRSVLEERFLALCEEHGLPLPEMNAEVCGLTVDALWRDQRVIVELDGHVAHGTPARAERDRGRELRLRAAGFVVLRYTWQQVTTTPAAVGADVARALRG